ncbi:effector-binding domain-containing protein [Zhouia amylolytica]|uniref:Effector-binding domain-containing protein n=1 Tax=Zhouia amylolytica TaxID=376730 RepID=A0A1I6RS37_9FLAO|nr:GyrI-like domain-containing protein [Zhouia amylolytica]SFS67539.1 effector-binding domain-containing protein [Zhouia amylolytica]
MKIIKYLFFLIVIIVIGLSLYIATRSGYYNVHREAVIDAPKEVVYEYINDYKKWPEWSPWIEQEPSANISLSDSTAGINSFYHWNGDIIGEGIIKTIHSDKDSILQKIEFTKPRESQGDVYWKLSSKTPSQSIVTWGIKGELSFLEKAIMIYKGGMDNLIGSDLERGLFKIDSLSELAIEQYTINPKGISEYSGGYYLYLTTASKQSGISSKMTEMFLKVKKFAKENNITLSGPPFVLYHEWDDLNKTTIFSTCIPIREKIIPDFQSEVLCGFLDSGRYFKTVLKGNYKNIEEAWSKASQAINTNRLVEDPKRDPMEVYITDPSKVPNPANWITEIYIPVKKTLTLQKTF